eukprot:30717-Pelagococcus_subviridis.AAC.5
MPLLRHLILVHHVPDVPRVALAFDRVAILLRASQRLSLHLLNQRHQRVLAFPPLLRVLRRRRHRGGVEHRTRRDPPVAVALEFHPREAVDDGALTLETFLFQTFRPLDERSQTLSLRRALLRELRRRELILRYRLRVSHRARLGRLLRVERVHLAASVAVFASRREVFFKRRRARDFASFASFSARMRAMRSSSSVIGRRARRGDGDGEERSAPGGYHGGASSSSVARPRRFGAGDADAAAAAETSAADGRPTPARISAAAFALSACISSTFARRSSLFGVAALAGCPERPEFAPSPTFSKFTFDGSNGVFSVVPDRVRPTCFAAPLAASIPALATAPPVVDFFAVGVFFFFFFARGVPAAGPPSTAASARRGAPSAALSPRHSPASVFLATASRNPRRSSGSDTIASPSTSKKHISCDTRYRVSA